MNNQVDVFFLNFRSGRNKDSNQLWARVEYCDEEGNTGMAYLRDPSDESLVDKLSVIKTFTQVTLVLILTPSTKGWRAALVDIKRKEV